MHYRKEVDGLRALAVVPVVLFHAQVPGFAGGFAGVDIFFVISGYLITSIIHTELKAGSFSIAQFYERRIRRLLPALFVVLAASVAMSVAWLTPSAAQDFFKSLIAVPLFGSNLYFAETTGYFSTAAELKPLLHTWSLAVEEQYYLFFPLLMLIAWRLAPQRIIPMIALVLVVSLAFAVRYSSHSPTPTFFSMPARCWELLMGAMAALYLADRPPPAGSNWKRQAASLAGLALILVVVLIEAPMAVPGFYSLLPTVGAVLIILFAWPGTIAHALLSQRVFVGIGLISYSLYLWHQPLMAFTRIRALGVHDLVQMSAVVALTFVFAYLTWRYVETPFRRRDRIPARRLVPAAVAGSLAFVAAGLVALQVDYASLRYGEGKAARSREIMATVKPDRTCLQGYGAIEAQECVFGAVTSSKTLAVIGDSHAAQWADTLDRLGQERGIRIVMFAKAACASADVRYEYHALRREYWECTQWRTHVVDKLRTANAGAVLITNSSFGYAGQGGLVPSDEWKRGVSGFVRQVRQHAPRVFWLIDNPRYPVNPMMCFEANFWHDENHACSVPRKDAIDEALVRLEREALAPLPTVTVADFHDFFCDAQRCASLTEHGPLMRDSNHMTASTAARLQLRLANLVRDAF